MTECVILTNVSKHLRGKTILSDINLNLESGKIYGFYGRNASGKTMLFRTIAGLLIPDQGSVVVFGQKITADKSFPDSMGLIIENVGLWKNLTGMENLRLLAGITRKANENELRDAVSRVGLDPDDPRKYGAYSMGMKQKLIIAQAIMEKPTILILDEPTNGLDEDGVIRFRNLILEEKERGATCLIATHQKDDIKQLCDQVFHMKDGRCLLADPGEWS